MLDVSGVAFTYHSVCHPPTSDDSVSCSFQMKGKNKSLTVF